MAHGPLQTIAFNPTVMICSGSSIDTSKLVATVRKAGDKKALIELEKKGQTEYTVEGDLIQRNYMIKLNNTQVAQVTCQLSMLVPLRHADMTPCAKGVARPHSKLALCFLVTNPPCLVCQVSHDDVNARVAVTSGHCYSVTVAPGTDCVLMIAAAMAVEDMYTP